MENSLSDLLTRYLDQAKSYVEVLDNAPDVTDVIHDFRLSIRRLRSWLKICREQKVATLPTENRKELKSLVDITNESRDLDVHVKLLKEYIDGLNLSTNMDVERVLEKWNAKRKTSHKSTIQDAQKTFEKAEPELRKFISSIKGYEEAHQLKLTKFVERVMTEVAKELDNHLDAIASIEDVETIHRARILAKTLRYLGEPFAKSNQSFELIVNELHSLQDVIGGLRDAQIFAQELGIKQESTALKAIYDRNQSYMMLFFSTFEATYLKPQGSRFKNKIKLLFATIPEQP